MSQGTDSAGTPWSGRHFDDNAFADDDGTAPPKLLEALLRFRAGELGESEVVDAVRDTRLLIPLVARLGEAGEGEHGHIVDKSAELAIVTVEAPDGRSVLPAFTSAAAMSAWNPKARPVPADGTRVALAAASEDTDLVILDPTSPTEFAIRRPALWALAKAESWIPSYLDREVLQAFLDSATREPAVSSLDLDHGDPDARLAGPELIVYLGLRPGLDAAQLDSLLARLQEGWAASPVIAARVDSMAIKLATAAG
ncbi:SseB family protein [soil metagenome]